MKGQVAIEYLVTYGWAIFAFMVILAIITSFVSLIGMAGREYCIFPPQLVCNNFLLESEGDKLWLNLSNNFEFPVMVRKVQISYKGKPVEVEENQLLPEDGYLYVVFPLEDVKEGETLKTDVLVWYSPCPSVCSEESYVIRGTLVVKAS